MFHAILLLQVTADFTTCKRAEKNSCTGCERPAAATADLVTNYTADDCAGYGAYRLFVRSVAGTAAGE
nr:hypothetical protein [Sedimenticola sp.]